MLCTAVFTVSKVSYLDRSNDARAWLSPACHCEEFTLGLRYYTGVGCNNGQLKVIYQLLAPVGAVVR